MASISLLQQANIDEETFTQRTGNFRIVMLTPKSSMKVMRWLDVAVVACREPVTASVYPINMGIDAPSFAVTIHHRWIVGGDGNLTVFETPEAARRFLQLLGIKKVLWKGEGKPPNMPSPVKFRRFLLSKSRLSEDVSFLHH